MTETASRTTGRTLEKEILIHAPPERVFRALTTKEDLERWSVTEAFVDPRPGGRLRFVWISTSIEGVFITVSPTLIVYTLDERPLNGFTTVTITLAAEAGGTRVHLSHTGFGEGEDWDALYRGLDSGWGEGLDDLRAWIDDGRAKVWPGKE
jgi:uncharacterized protein YndB with AHSA1/START domain